MPRHTFCAPGLHSHGLTLLCGKLPNSASQGGFTLGVRNPLVLLVMRTGGCAEGPACDESRRAEAELGFCHGLGL